MRVDQADPAAGGDVLCDAVQEEGRLARAGLADDEQVAAAVGRVKGERGVAALDRSHA
jgi:hypothetical protein